MKNKSTLTVLAWRKKKRSEGWRDIAMLLPPEVKSRVIAYKNKLMKEYREER